MRISDETKASSPQQKRKRKRSEVGGTVLWGPNCLSNKVSKTSDKSCTEITPRNHNMRLVDEVDDVLLALDFTPIGPIPGPPERDTIGLG